MTGTNYVLSIDPGISTGLALLSYTDESPAELVQAWQFGGGVGGFLDWHHRHTYEYIEGSEVFHPGGHLELGHPDCGHWTDVVTVVAEKFQPINHANYALTTASVEPLRVEGAMIALGLMPDYDVSEKRWRAPAGQYIFGGTSKADKKKRQHAWLKANGFYRTGKSLGTPDADDFRSAGAHGLAYLARELKHKPTFGLLTGWVENNAVATQGS